ncbi:hypothetical protein CC78DRAFT_565188 [Lojkania enalia]|uniref:Uncharacterized protein n=1 Tax=Lojkania enalia TaxID=147567 RepID=A0A9P4KGH5_9PLEO|nr:hypothetical protein CC78DRAFT_565188 [Didymosphaeria enalia]
MTSLRFSVIAVIFVSVFYQWWLKDALFVTLGIGRKVESIERFPYKCRQLTHEQLEACGDMWLDEKSRVLYAACVGMEAREQWNPSLSRFNASGRRPGGSEVMAVYIDKPRKDGLFKMHKISPTGYGSGPGEGRLDLTGFDVEVVDDYTLRFWLLNQRPPYSSSGQILDASKFGANTTIDVYEYKKGEKKMTYLAMGKSSALHSPNKIAFMGGNNFVVSNDRSAKIGFRKRFDPLFKSGSLVYHDDWFDSYVTTPKSVPYPGLITRGPDDRVYVPSLVDDRIRIFELRQGGTFDQVYAMKLGMPITGVTVDSEGDFWAVGRSKYDPKGFSSSNTLFKVEKFVERRFRYIPTRVLEDKEAQAIQGASVARHDVKTKRLFLGGAFMPFITVCEVQS